MYAWGGKPFGRLLGPAERLARDGFVVDETFRSQTADHQARFAGFPATAELCLPGGQLPVTGSVFKNPDLALRTGRRAVRASTSCTGANCPRTSCPRCAHRPWTRPPPGWCAPET
ncbi:hypothetical protein GCM10010446_58080 [Streptomyces enissocaesilis]|uniref:Uncharacterized protein n=1 Tax=Streptomyces enissocaesilis TaxID=332589 RepID=A0ABP6K2W2_9ACTN